MVLALRVQIVFVLHLVTVVSAHPRLLDLEFEVQVLTVNAGDACSHAPILWGFVTSTHVTCSILAVALALTSHEPALRCESRLHET